MNGGPSSYSGSDAKNTALYGALESFVSFRGYLVAIVAAFRRRDRSSGAQSGWPRSRPEWGAVRSEGAHATSRCRLLRDEVVRLLHETGLTSSALARLQWDAAMHPERLRVFAANGGAANLSQARWTAIVTILDELWHAETGVGHGTPDSYVVRFYGGSDLVSRANSIRQILQPAPAQPVIHRVLGRHATSRDSRADGVALRSTRVVRTVR